MNVTYRKKDGGWQLIVSYKDGSGRWKQKSKQGFKSKHEAKEAEEKLLEQVRDLPRPIDTSMAGISLSAFCDVYLDYKKSITEGTKRTYRMAVKSLGSLAERPINKITFLELQKVINEWQMKPGTQLLYKSKLSAMYKAAVKPFGLVNHNPVADIEIPRQREKRNPRIISEDTMKQIITDAPDDVRMAVLLGWYTGMRRGELLALTWDDINFTESTINVNKQLDATEHAVVARTKSYNGKRSIPAPAVLLAALKKYRTSHVLRLDKKLFPHPVNLYQKMLARMQKHGASPHYLRHSYATRLVASGVDIRTVAALMGDNVQTVISTYVHYTDDMRAAAAHDIARIFAANF